MGAGPLYAPGACKPLGVQLLRRRTAEARNCARSGAGGDVDDCAPPRAGVPTIERGRECRGHAASRASHARCTGGHLDPAGRRRPRAADRLCEPDESALGARRRPPEGTRRSQGAWRESRTRDPATADRERRPREPGDSLRRGPLDRDVHLSCATRAERAASRHEPGPRRTRAALRVWGRGADGSRRRYRARVRSGSRRPRRGAQDGHDPRNHRLRQPACAPRARRRGDDVDCRVAGGCRIAAAELRESPRRRTRVPAAQSLDRRDRASTIEVPHLGKPLGILRSGVGACTRASSRVERRIRELSTARFQGRACVHLDRREADAAARGLHSVHRQ